jgi:uncharacterized protein with FMN-binding domain
MRRAPIVIAATALGTAAVLGFNAHQSASPISAAPIVAESPSAPSSTSTSPSSSPASSKSGRKTALGDGMSTRYGAAQVRVTVSNGKIVKIDAIQLQDSDPKSAAISSSAAPILRQSVLSKQTAAVDTVSGATYTSLSYEGSLQSALDKLGFKTADGTQASTDMSQLQ